MPKKTQNKASELAKPGKNSSAAEKNAYDIVDSVNKIKNTGKSSRTKKKENAESYEKIMQHSDILFSILKEKVDLNEATRKANQIYDEAILIYNTCGEYLAKNRGFRWSTKGRERVRQVKRLRNAIWMGIVTETNYEHAKTLFARQETYGQFYAMSSYLSTNTTVASSNVSPQAQSESATGSENSNQLDVNYFNNEIPSVEDLKTYVKNCIGNDSNITLFEGAGVFEELKVGKEAAANNLEWFIIMNSIAGNRGIPEVELIWNSYRYAINRSGGELLPELKEYFNLK